MREVTVQQAIEQDKDLAFSIGYVNLGSKLQWLEVALQNGLELNDAWSNWMFVSMEGIFAEEAK